MSIRLLNLAVAISAIAFCLVVVAWFAAADVDPRKQFLSLSQHCHLSASARGLDARVHVFNDATYGPYGGSIVGISGGGATRVVPEYPKVTGVGDVAGIYYRMIRQRDGASLWTLSLSLVYPLLVSAAFPVLWLVWRSRRALSNSAVGDKAAAG